MAKATTYAGPTTHKDKKDWEYVTIPEKDLFDNKNPGFDINTYHFDAGTHFVPPDLASEIKRIVQVAMDADIRILQPKKHLKSLIESGLMKSTPAGKSEILVTNDE